MRAGRGTTERDHGSWPRDSEGKLQVRPAAPSSIAVVPVQGRAKVREQEQVTESEVEWRAVPPVSREQVWASDRAPVSREAQDPARAARHICAPRQFR